MKRALSTTVSPRIRAPSLESEPPPNRSGDTARITSVTVETAHWTAANSQKRPEFPRSSPGNAAVAMVSAAAVLKAATAPYAKNARSGIWVQPSSVKSDIPDYRARRARLIPATMDVLKGAAVSQICEPHRNGRRLFKGWRQFSAREMVRLHGEGWHVLDDTLVLSPEEIETEGLTTLSTSKRGSCDSETMRFDCLSGKDVANWCSEGTFDVFIFPDKSLVRMTPKQALRGILRKDPLVFSRIGRSCSSSRTRRFKKGKRRK